MKKVPRLRFRGFQDDWEHRKLDDSIKVMDGDRGANYPHDTDFFKDGDTLFLDTGNVTKNGFKFDSVKYITNEKDEQLRAGKLEKNDFVLTSRGTLGNVGFYDEVVYNLHPKIRINSAMLILRNTDEQLSYSYLHTLLKGQLISDFMKKNQVGSAQPHITKSEFLKLNLNVPCNINEQNKIGNFFKSLDVTITLHQRKLDQLKELKKAYLQVMFPEKDERVPKLRFADFEEEWELCKFSDILETHSTKKYLAEPNKNGEFEVIQQGDNPIIGYATGKAFLDYNKIVLFGDHTLSLYKPKRPFFVATDGIKILSGKNTIGKFLFTLLQRYMPNSQGYKRHFTILKNENIYYTSTDTEQLEIGDLFLRFDILTTYYQDRIINLKKLKKSYLQNMFI
ncbi:restriction endonuclease subunit S [Enterococcus faecalis]|uniref:restriction endonuclease subunit S n=1 Tax=Enterococcus faecalis TaxID=1351 RepID=UPI00288D4B40|nr:restriction endonuclease subunit S [Enterococcus faecalis]MDT2114071.1 restriction endonuclease subunit S [Enterococcus faecalis]